MEEETPQDPLIEVRSMTLKQFMESDNPVIRDLIDRVLKDAEDPGEVISGFQSAAM
jgi:FXSXX-COOH protein